MICFFCGGCLHNWLPQDIPWNEHAKYQRKCPYLLLSKSPNFIQSIVNGTEIGSVHHENAASNEHRMSSSVVSFSTNDVTSTIRENLSSFKKRIHSCCKITEDEDEKKSSQDSVNHTHNERVCKLCMTNEANIVFVNCGHLLTCACCAASIDKCPICRCKFNQMIKVYYA